MKTERYGDMLRKILTDNLSDYDKNEQILKYRAILEEEITRIDQFKSSEVICFNQNSEDYEQLKAMHKRCEKLAKKEKFLKTSERYSKIIMFKLNFISAIIIFKYNLNPILFPIAWLLFGIINFLIKDLKFRELIALDYEEIEEEIYQMLGLTMSIESALILKENIKNACKERIVYFDREIEYLKQLIEITNTVLCGIKTIEQGLTIEDTLRIEYSNKPDNLEKRKRFVKNISLSAKDDIYE